MKRRIVAEIHVPIEVDGDAPANEIARLGYRLLKMQLPSYIVHGTRAKVTGSYLEAVHEDPAPRSAA